MTFVTGTRTPENVTSAWPCWSWWPSTGDRRVLELGQPRLGRQEQVPQALGLGLLLQLLDHRRDDMAVGAGGPAVGQVLGLGGQDPLPHERDHPVLQFASPGTGGGHVVVKHRILLSKLRARSV